MDELFGFQKRGEFIEEAERKLSVNDGYEYKKEPAQHTEAV